jgi:hypothetical protein
MIRGWCFSELLTFVAQSMRRTPVTVANLGFYYAAKKIIYNSINLF